MKCVFFCNLTSVEVNLTNQYLISDMRRIVLTQAMYITCVLQI